MRSPGWKGAVCAALVAAVSVVAANAAGPYATTPTSPGAIDGNVAEIIGAAWL